MLDTLEFILRVLFFALSIIWAGRIMILRTDKQIIINPLLIIISSLLVLLPSSNECIRLLGMSIQNIKITLYCIYLVIVLLGIYSTNKKNGLLQTISLKIDKIGLLHIILLKNNADQTAASLIDYLS